MSLKACKSKGEKYNKILDELLQINTRHSADLFCYHLPQNYMGRVDEERFANESILHLFCYQDNLKLSTLYKPDVRKKLSISDKEFKEKVAIEQEKIFQEYKIARSNKINEGLVFLSLLRDYLDK